jgi:uncharacterized protein (TIGR00369 family)
MVMRPGPWRMLPEPTSSPMPDFASPYARTLGLTLAHDDGGIIVTMPMGDGVMGRPGFLHGGAIAGLLEYAAWATLLADLEDGAKIKPIAITVDFMRGGKPIDSFASAAIVREGRRIANVIATAWQDDPAKPIASANLKFLIERPVSSVD